MRNLTPVRATQLAGTNPDYATEDLLEAVERGDYPMFTLYVQIMTLEQADELEFNAFNVTKLWPQKKFPLREVGCLNLNRNVQNHWDETEQGII